MLVTLMTLFACVEDVSKDKVEAKVEDVKPEAAAKAEQPEAAKAAVATPKGVAWAVDAETSTIKALGAKITATHPIDFPKFTGQVYVDEGAVSGVAFEVDMASLVSDDDRLTGHLKNEDFFDVTKFPTSKFTSTTVKAGSDIDGMTHTIVGEFTIHGQTKKVTFPAKVAMEDNKVSAETEFALDRKDFGVVYPGRPDDLVQDKVVLTVNLAAAKPEA
ncbi:MAG: YceI family protein [Myxococcota bacterium]